MPDIWIDNAASWAFVHESKYWAFGHPIPPCTEQVPATQFSTHQLGAFLPTEDTQGQTRPQEEGGNPGINTQASYIL